MTGREVRAKTKWKRLESPMILGDTQALGPIRAVAGIREERERLGSGSRVGENCGYPILRS